MVYYFAFLNGKDVCVDVGEQPVPVTEPYQVPIDSLDYSLIGKWYNRKTGEFEPATFKHLSEHSTDEINVGKTDECLTDALNNRANKNHTHDEYISREGGTIDGSLKLKNLNISRGTAPESVQTFGITFFDKDGEVNSTDRLASMIYQLNTDNTSTLNIMSTDPTDGTGEKQAGVRIQWINGTPRIAITNHPVTGSNDHSIATTAWVNAAIKKALAG